jgi:hypothetical protein
MEDLNDFVLAYNEQEERVFIKRNGSHVITLNEEEFVNKAYWHGSRRDKSLANGPMLEKINNKDVGGYECTFFSSHFGYSLAYALNLELYDYGSFDSIQHYVKKIKLNSNKIIERIKTQLQNNSAWLIPIRTIDVNIFNANQPNDFSKLWDLMDTSIHPSIKDFIGKCKDDRDFKEKMSFLKTIDWLRFTQPICGFTRDTLLKIIYDASYLQGSYIFKGFYNFEKTGSFPSIGIFKERMKNIGVGPLYEVKLYDNNELIIDFYKNSQNTSNDESGYINKPRPLPWRLPN